MIMMRILSDVLFAKSPLIRILGQVICHQQIKENAYHIRNRLDKNAIS